MKVQSPLSAAFQLPVVFPDFGYRVFFPFRGYLSSVRTFAPGMENCLAVLFLSKFPLPDLYERARPALTVHRYFFS